MTNTPESLQNLERRARAGEAPAQLALCQALLQTGRPQEALEWSEKAAATGDPNAVLMLAWLLLNHESPLDFQRVHELLGTASAAKDPRVARLHATLLATGAGRTPDWSRGISLILAAAEVRDKAVLRELALITALADPGHPSIPGLLCEAARKGDGLAAFAVLRSAARGHPIATSAEHAAWREHLKRAGHPLIETLGATPEADAPSNAASTIDAALLQRLPSRPIPLRRQISSAPTVWRIDGLLTEQECDYLVGLAGPLVAPALVINPTTGSPMRATERTSNNAMLVPYKQDLAVHCLNHRLAAAAEIPVENGEVMSILRYRPGEEYRPHFDFLGEGSHDAAALKVSGQRVATLLVSLSPDYTGGETVFLKTNLKWRGSVGDALLFMNVDAEGKPDLTTRHAGLPVTSGEKWLLSKWYRAGPYAY